MRSPVTDPYARVKALIADQPATADGDRAGVRADMRRLCTAAAQALDACGVGLTVMTGDGVRALGAATDPVTERLEELQLTLGEGPCIDAFTLRRPILVADLGDGASSRWPTYIPGVYALGVRAVFAFPLQVGAARLGMIDVFRAASGLLSADQLTLALVFAEVAIAALLDGQEHASTHDRGDWLGDVLGPRTQLFQAQGMVMVQLGGSLADALARIRAHAYAENRSLGEVAADVVARRLRFDTDQS
jgi:ANTAR domain